MYDCLHRYSWAYDTTVLVVPVLVNLSPGSAVRVFHNNRNKQPQQTAAANNRNKQQQQKTIKS